MFDNLNLVAHPVCGRGVVWINSNLDKSRRPDSKHSALPVLKEGAEKWVAQLWFRSYAASFRAKAPSRTDAVSGMPLNENDELPAGVTLPTAREMID